MDFPVGAQSQFCSSRKANELFHLIEIEIMLSYETVVNFFCISTDEKAPIA